VAAIDNQPFAAGSVSLRLYPHNELPASEVIAELCAQARLALSHGFDGVMTSEHHGGFPGYLPNPLQMVTFVLEENQDGWVAACPLLLPLRPTTLVAEEVAWLAARHPRRVGVGVAAGALPLDFEVTGVPIGSAVASFKAELPRLVDMLRGDALGELRADPALGRCATHPVPVLSAAASTAAATRAAACGAGILMEGMSAPDRLASICASYDEAGGHGSKTLIRRVWLGDPQRDLVDRQRKVYDSYAGGAKAFGTDQTIGGHDPDEIAGRLHDVLTVTRSDALNVRIHLPGMPPEHVREQIVRLGTDVVPRLKTLLSLAA
jgi:alkanesulfonate monooxygenase SsuD/methylene tetrahydromethanopterin reductase-like flavin-dependent oxidoreductase (luciferase family)